MILARESVGTQHHAPSTPCPDPIHLRLFYYAPAHATESNSLRAHVAQCETCRAIVGELEGADAPRRVQTEKYVVRGREPSSADSTVIIPASNGAAQVQAGDQFQHTLSDEFSDQPSGPSSSVAESTVILPAEKTQDRGRGGRRQPEYDCRWDARSNAAVGFIFGYRRIHSYRWR